MSRALVILQTFCRFTYVTVLSPTLLSLLLRHKLFTYVTWGAAHGINIETYNNIIIPITKKGIINENNLV